MIPVYLQSYPTWRHLLIGFLKHSFLSFIVLFIVVLLVLVILVVGVRLNVLGDLIGSITVGTTEVFLNGHLGALWYMLLTLLTLAVLWNLLVLLNASSSKRRLSLLDADATSSPTSTRLPNTLKRLGLALLAGAIFNLPLAVFFAGSVSPIAGALIETPWLKLYYSLLIAEGGLGAALLGLSLWIRWKRGRRQRVTLVDLLSRGELGLDFFLIIMLAVAILLPYSVRYLPLWTGILWIPIVGVVLLIWWLLTRRRGALAGFLARGELGFDVLLMVALLFGIVFAAAAWTNKIFPTPTPSSLPGLNRALAVFPDSAPLLWERSRSFASLITGDAGSESEHFRRAKADLDRAIELEPEEANYYFRRANLFGDHGLVRESLADLDKLIELSPYSAWAYIEKARVFGRLGEPHLENEVLTLITELPLKANLSNADDFLVQCGAALRIGAYARAESACSQVFLLSPPIGEREELAASYVGMGNLAAARRTIADGGGSLEAQFAATMPLRPEDVPGFNIFLFGIDEGDDRARGAITREFREHLPPSDPELADRVGLDSLASQGPRPILRHGLRSILFNWVAVYQTEDDSADGFAFHSNRNPADEAWAGHFFGREEDSHVVVSPRIGDESVHYEGRFGAEEDLEVREIVVVRIGNVVAAVGLSFPAHRDPPIQALDLAQIQAQRIREFLAQH